MARAQATDPLHNFRFHAGIVVQADGWQGSLSTDIIGNSAGEAGFNSFTAPEITLEWQEYREGVRIFTEKYPGIPSMNDLTLGRGVARTETNFFEWMLAAVENREYRVDLNIYHMPRSAMARPQANESDPGEGLSGLGFPDRDDSGIAAAKTYRIFNAGPSRVKIAGDLDATSGDVSITEMEVVYERFDVLAPS